MQISSLAGHLPNPSLFLNVPRLITAYYSQSPDMAIPEQRVLFGTSGHRGNPYKCSFNQAHILAITQAICLYRKVHQIDGPLFLGVDTHALSEPALASAMEVLAANGVNVLLSKNDEYTPTPAVSHAILCYNKNRKSGLADGIVITPSHNPPEEGGFKYNAINGGPAEPIITNWIQSKANEFLEKKLAGVERIEYSKALRAQSTGRYDYLNTYVDDLINVIDLRAIKESGIRLGVDPLGGAGVHYWRAIADRYQIALEVVSEEVDPTFRFMTVDWDGKIRMDPSSPYAMQRLIHLKDQYDIAFACDTDHDRHGIVTKSKGLLPPNHFFSAAIHYLIGHRPIWNSSARIGKTVVSSALIDRVAQLINRKVYEVPVGFKWFVEGLLDGSLSFGCEESAGASFLRLNGEVWTTDKDGIIPSLLAAEMTAKLGKDPGVIYDELTRICGAPIFERQEGYITLNQREQLKQLSSDQVTAKTLAGEPVTAIVTRAPGNDAPIGGIKVLSENGWFAVRPSGTELIYKIYAESFLGKDHLNKILEEARHIVDKALN